MMGWLIYWIPKPLKSKEVASGKPSDSHTNKGTLGVITAYVTFSSGTHIFGYKICFPMHQGN